MKRGFGWHAWLEARARTRRLRANALARERIRKGAEERAAQAALRPSTGNVVPFPVKPPTEGSE